MLPRPLQRPLLAALLSVCALAVVPRLRLDAQRAGHTTRELGRLVETLSEPGGFFDTDNLISNERSYLHVIGALERLGVTGGAYIGVGPAQNFSYIAQVRPSVAFIIDIRRDNLLQHLMFKALFALSQNRAEYLHLLLGRPVPRNVERWAERPIDALVAWLDDTPATRASAESARTAVLDEVRRSGIPLSADDLATIERFHTAFIEAGLDLRFTSTGRAPRWYYPTLRQLLTETDLEGRTASYLASETDFQFLKDLQRRNLVIPVTGDLAGSHALASIGRLIAERGLRVSAFYTSNVEDYLLRDGSFADYSRTVVGLPRDERSVIIRSYFGGGYPGSHPQAAAGYYSTQLLQRLDTFAAAIAAGGYRSYRELVLNDPVPLRGRGGSPSLDHP